MITSANCFIRKLLSVFALADLALLDATLPAQKVETGFKSLFNGNDLTGWDGRAKHWSGEQGANTAGQPRKIELKNIQIKSLK